MRGQWGDMGCLWMNVLTVQLDTSTYVLLFCSSVTIRGLVGPSNHSKCIAYFQNEHTPFTTLTDCCVNKSREGVTSEEENLILSHFKLWCCLLGIEKTRAQDKTYEWGSVWYEGNRQEIHECDGRTHDLDTMVDPLTPKPTHKTKTLVRVPTTIVSCHEEDVSLRKWPSSRYCSVSCILETKT